MNLRNEFLESLSRSKAMKHVENLAQIKNRLAGTPEEKKACEYIVDNLEQAGIKPEVIEFNAHLKVPIDSELELIPPVDRRIESFPTSGGADTGPEGVFGEILDVGYGYPEEYGEKSAEGKILLMSLGGEISRAEKTEIAGTRKPTAVLLFHNADLGIQKGTCKSVQGNPTPETNRAPYVPNIPVLSIGYQEGMFIRQLLKEKPINAWLRSKSYGGWPVCHIVSAKINGEKADPYSDEFVMLGGHYDSWNVGAICNAVGTAAQLEWARVYRKFAGELKRNARIMFWSGHELGMGAGAVWYADNYWDELMSGCVYYQNNDSIGEKDYSFIACYITPELETIHRKIMSDIGIPPSVKNIVWDFPQAGADISTFLLHAGLPSLTDIALRGAEDVKEGMDMNQFLHTESDDLSRAAQSMFDVPFTITTGTFAEIMNSDILPFDFNRVASLLTVALNEYHEKASEIVDERIVHEAGEFKRLVKNLHEKTKSLSGDKEATKSVNRLLMRLARTINPVLLSGFRYWDKGEGGLYTHARGRLKPKVIPRLQEVDKLDSLEEDSRFALKTRLVRNRNKVMDAVKEANEIVKRTLDELA